jgi:hypothetical protein
VEQVEDLEDLITEEVAKIEILSRLVRTTITMWSNIKTRSGEVLLINTKLCLTLVVVDSVKTCKDGSMISLLMINKLDPKVDILHLNSLTTTEAVVLQVQEVAEAINLFITISETTKVHLPKNKINRTL